MGFCGVNPNLAWNAPWGNVRNLHFFLLSFLLSLHRASCASHPDVERAPGELNPSLAWNAPWGSAWNLHFFLLLFLLSLQRASRIRHPDVERPPGELNPSLAYNHEDPWGSTKNLHVFLLSLQRASRASHPNAERDSVEWTPTWPGTPREAMPGTFIFSCCRYCCHCKEHPTLVTWT